MAATDNFQGYHLHFDVVGGIAGDMFCAAILDTWPHLTEPLLHALTHILPPDSGEPKVWNETNASMHVKRFALIENEDVTVHAQHHKQQHQPHKHQHSHSEHSGHHHTTYLALKQRIEQSELTSQVIEIAVEMLTILAKAEAKMHDVPIEHVHFHELADWDSLMDVISAAYLIDAVNIATVSFSDLPLGHGLVKTQHGLLPIPAPATTEILSGFRCRDDGIAGERITPTGAAILRYLHSAFPVGSVSQHTLEMQGFGGGSRTLKGMPNLLRVAVFSQEPSDAHVAHSDEMIQVIETDIDDMTGEEIALACDILRAQEGVIDISVATLRGKKNRATERLSILCQPTYLESVCEAIFLQTSTIGVRFHGVNRKVLHRTHSHLAHNGHAVEIKCILRPQGDETTKVESDSLKAFSTLAARRAVQCNAKPK